MKSLTLALLVLACIGLLVLACWYTYAYMSNGTEETPQIQLEDLSIPVMTTKPLEVVSEDVVQEDESPDEEEPLTEIDLSFDLKDVPMFTPVTDLVSY